MRTYIALAAKSDGRLQFVAAQAQARGPAPMRTTSPGHAYLWQGRVECNAWLAALPPAVACDMAEAGFRYVEVSIDVRELGGAAGVPTSPRREPAAGVTP